MDLKNDPLQIKVVMSYSCSDHTPTRKFSFCCGDWPEIWHWASQDFKMWREMEITRAYMTHIQKKMKVLLDGKVVSNPIQNQSMGIWSWFLCPYTKCTLKCILASWSPRPKEHVPQLPPSICWEFMETGSWGEGTASDLTLLRAQGNRTWLECPCCDKLLNKLIQINSQEIKIN